MQKGLLFKRKSKNLTLSKNTLWAQKDYYLNENNKKERDGTLFENVQNIRNDKKFKKGPLVVCFADDVKMTRNWKELYYASLSTF